MSKTSEPVALDMYLDARVHMCDTESQYDECASIHLAGVASHFGEGVTLPGPVDRQRWEKVTLDLVGACTCVVQNTAWAHLHVAGADKLTARCLVSE